MTNGDGAVLDRDAPQVIEEGPMLPTLLKDDFLKGFEKGIENYKRWLSACYRLTRASHWINHGKAGAPKYSLQGPGAEALCNPLSISFDKPEMHREEVTDDKGDFYIWWCEGYVESRTLGRRGWYVGYCDSRDQFFNARPGWNPKTGSGDVKKAAMMNWVVNAVSRLAGLRDPDPSTLIAAGIKLEDIPGVEYKSGTSSQQKTLEGGGEVISEPQSKRFYAIAKGQNISDETIHAYLWDKYQLKSSKDIKKKDYEAICAWAQRGGQDEPSK